MEYTESNCPFCHLSNDVEIIAENELTIVAYDIFPVNKGHSLIIPKRHFSNFFEITSEEYKSAMNLISQVKDILDEKFCPDGYNIGVNINEAAGQTIPHCHIHVIPRYKGDIENPRGGVRHVIPSRGNY